MLFGLWEFVNGSRPASQNRLAREAAENVGALDLRQMALRHGPSALVVEARASGLPAVVYDIGGPRECIRPGETGFAVAFGDEKKFFEKLELLVDDAALRRRMGHAAREFATTLSWRAVLQGILDIHLGLAEGSAPPRVPAES